MSLSSRTALSQIAVLIGVIMHVSEAFSPLMYSSQSVAQLVRESQRFQPLEVGTALNKDNDADEDELDLPDVDAAAAEDYILKVGEVEEEEDVTEVGMEDDGEPPAWAASQQRLAELRRQHRRHETDTGSPEYQVAGMTERINYLTRHLQEHPKDFSTRRGLVALVNKRRRMLNYLFRTDVTRYAALVSSLGIRHKAPGRVPDRDEQYGRFPTQKAIKPHVLKKQELLLQQQQQQSKASSKSSSSSSPKSPSA